MDARLKPSCARASRAAACLLGLIGILMANAGILERGAGAQEPADSVAAQPARSEVRILSETDDQLLFELITPHPATERVLADGREYVQVRVSGYHRPRQAGQPDLPWKEVQIAVPPGMQAIIATVESAERPLIGGVPLPRPTEEFVTQGGKSRRDPDELYQHVVTYAPDPQVYESISIYPAQQATVATPHRWRHLRVAPLQLYPVRYDPGQRSLLWCPRMVVQVRFVPLPGAERAEPETPYLHPEPRWEPVYERRILNHERARRYRRAPRAVKVMRLDTLEESTFQIRLGVDSTDVYTVAYEDLATTGADLEDLAWSELRLLVRGYSDTTTVGDTHQEWGIPFHPHDVDGDGLFESGESFVFYGQDAWDFFDYEPQDKRYLRRNIYWLLDGATSPATMDTLPGWLDAEDLSPLTLYDRTIHFERNVYYMPIMAAEDQNAPRLGPWVFATDHYNWTHPEAMELSVHRPIKVVPLDMPRLLRLDELRVHVQGQQYLGGTYNPKPHQPRLWLSRSPSPADTTWPFPGNAYSIPPRDDILITIDGADIPGNMLRQGRTYLKIYLPRVVDGIDDVQGDGVGIDWAEVDFRGTFQMWQHQLVADLGGLTGIQQLRILDLKTTDALAFELGDARDPKVLALPESLFTASGDDWELRLQMDLGDLTGKSRLFVVERDHVRPLGPEAMSLKRGGGVPAFSGQDFVAIYAERFESTLQSLLDHRASQGHHLLAASVEDVYDAYSGGRRHPFAIKRLLREMWRMSDPSPDYLMLVGDASNDIANYAIALAANNSDTNYVPVMTISGHFYSSTGRQIVSSDHWYVDHLGGAWDEGMTYVADLYLGRIPCGSEEELSVYVNKVLDYELTGETATWRSHVVMHADDMHSSRITGLGGGTQYQYQAYEDAFIDISRKSAGFITGDSAFAHFDVDSLYQGIYMDSIPELGRCERDPENPERCLFHPDGTVVYVRGPIDYNPSLQYGQGVFHEILLESLNAGALVWAFQGHSNRALLTHEYVFRHSRGAAHVYQFTNIGHPFMFFGYGCHLGEYAHEWEGELRRGDAMAEIMLFCCPGEPKAAIAALGSTDYELIGHHYEDLTFEVMFSTPPTDADGRSRWHLGEITTAAKEGLSSSTEERITYTLLSDPGLRVGVFPPVFYLTTNGQPWEPETEELVSDSENDSLQLGIQIYDESYVGLPEVVDYYGVVPDSLLKPAGEPADDRRLKLTYDTQIQRRPYSLVVRTTDREGSQREVTLHVPMAITYYEKVGDELLPLEEGAVVADTASLVVTIRTGSHIAEEHVQFLVDGTAQELVQSDMTQAEGEPFNWKLSYAPLAKLSPGLISLETIVTQWDGEELSISTQGAEVGGSPLAFRRHYWIPSPFSSETTLVYELTQSASRARLRLFTVSGRKIFETHDLPVWKGLRHFDWDGRDDDGDGIANGLYFYQLTVWDVDGRQADEVIDKVVRAR